MSSTNPSQSSSATVNNTSPAKKDMEKHRKLIGSYILCRQCGETSNEPTSRIYLEDFRYMEHCVRCSFTGYLKEHHLI